MIPGAGIHGTQTTGTIHQFIVIIHHTGILIIITDGGILILTTADIILQLINTEQMMDIKSEITQEYVIVEEKEICLPPAMVLQRQEINSEPEKNKLFPVVV